MIAYFPDLYPDELVYSWFCRYYIHSGSITHKMALLELYCKRSDNPSKEFIGNIRPEVMDRIEDMYSLDDLVLKHTMYSQYARFIPLEQKKTALYSLSHDFCDAHHLFCILPRVEGEQYLKFCPMCAKEDRETYGEAYWHRKHQIRNMKICVKHKCRLMESDVPAKSEQSYTFYPAENYIYDHESIPESSIPAIQFAEFLEAVFDAPVDFAHDVPVSAILYDGMSRTKYLKPSGRSRYTKRLAEEMKVFYEKLGLCSISTINQIQKVLLGGQTEFSVVCQLAYFLGMKPEELTNPSLSMEQIQKEENSHYQKDNISVDWEQLDIETEPVLEKLVKGIYDGTASKKGRPERVSERIVYREMNLAGQRLENMPRCKAVFERYTESYPESWARKVIWAYQKLKERDDPFYWSDIRAISGVKKKHFQEIIPYLEKHTDADTADQIMQLIGNGEKVL